MTAAMLHALSGPNARAKIIAGVAILVGWQVGVAAYAPRFVAKPLDIVAVFPDVMADPDFLNALRQLDSRL